MTHPATHQILTTAGLSFDLVGAVLVGVEAVKLENLRRLRSAIDSRITNVLSVVNPTLTIVDGDVEPMTQSERLWFALWILGGLCMGMVALVPAYVLLIAAGIPPVDHWLPSLTLWVRVPLLGLIGGWLALLASTGLVGWAIPALVRRFVAMIDLLDAHTPTGGVGITGVLALVVGFSLQVVATWV